MLVSRATKLTPREKMETLNDHTHLAAQKLELAAISQKINHAALLRRVTELSCGLQCRLDDEDVLRHDLMSGVYVQLQLILEDGTVWLVRILSERYAPFHDEFANQMLLSECATLRWLESVDVPTPRLHGYGLRSDPRNEVGVGYMIIDKLPGRSFNLSTASEAQKAEVIEQWASISCILSKYPLDKIGSLTFNADGVIQVGPAVNDKNGVLPCIGPFTDARAFYSTWAETYLDLICDGRLFSSYAVDAFLMFRFLAEQAKTGVWFGKWQNLNSGPFYLAHTNDKEGHILVDDDFRITGIVNWSFARVVPSYEAFSPSFAFANSGSLFSEILGLSEEDRALGRELQRRGAPYNYFHSDEMRLFLFYLEAGMIFTLDETINVFRALVATFDGIMPDWPEWRRAQLSKLADDARLVAVYKVSRAAMPPNPMYQVDPMPQVDRFMTCSISACGRPSVRGEICETGLKNLCAIHILPRHHKCPSIAEVRTHPGSISYSSIRQAFKCWPAHAMLMTI